jgi:hypothetical protein
MVLLLWPYLVVKTNYDVNVVPLNHHVLKKNLPITGIKKGAFSEDFDLAGIKKFTKATGSTINDYIGALLGTGLHDYFTKHQNEKGVQYKIPSEIDTLIPFSFRQPVKEVKDVKLLNDFCAVGCKLTIKKTMEEALKE